MTIKTCVNCPGATDHDTANCPLRGGFDHFPALLESVQQMDAMLKAEGAQGEREAFEAFMRKRGEAEFLQRSKHDPEKYDDYDTQHAWRAWEARAALAQPSPKCDHCHDTGYIHGTECGACEKPSTELERPEVVAWQYRVTAGPQTGWSLWHPGKGEEYERSYTVERRQLITVTQHDRIVSVWRERVRSTYVDLTRRNNELIVERDDAKARQEHAESVGDNLANALKAAQARVAELEANAAVSLPPFAEKVLSKLRRFYDCAEDFESGGVDIGRHWLDLLTQLGLLNRVQRSPALWEISQQGEDLLEAPVAQAGQVSETTNEEANSFLRIADAGQFKDNAVAVRTAAVIIRGLLNRPAIMQSIIRHRIGLTPEYEGQWHADLYGETGEVQHHAEADTPDEAVRAVVALAAAPAQGGGA